MRGNCATVSQRFCSRNRDHSSEMKTRNSLCLPSPPRQESTTLFIECSKRIAFNVPRVDRNERRRGVVVVVVVRRIRVSSWSRSDVSRRIVSTLTRFPLTLESNSGLSGSRQMLRATQLRFAAPRQSIARLKGTFGCASARFSLCLFPPFVNYAVYSRA